MIVVSHARVQPRLRSGERFRDRHVFVRLLSAAGGADAWRGVVGTHGSIRKVERGGRSAVATGMAAFAAQHTNSRSDRSLAVCGDGGGGCW